MAIYQYSGRGDTGKVSHDGGKTWSSLGSSGNGGNSNSSAGKATSNGASKNNAGTTWNNYTGNTGKQYSVAGSNGTIQVTRPDGTQATVRPTDSNYQATYDAMTKDLGGAYTPTNSFNITQADGTTKTYNTKSYTQGNSDLQYALQQAAKTNPGISTDEYVASLVNRVGTQRADGSTVTLQNVTDELTRLDLQDYLPGNAIYTASGKLLPGNQYVSYKDDNGMTTNSQDSRWASYGGQDYLIGGDSSDYVNYVNALTGNYNNMDYIYGGADMANNPYAQQNPEFLAQFNNTLAQLYANAGANGGVNTNTSGTVSNNTVNQQLSGLLDYTDSLGQLSTATGQNSYSSDLWSQIQALLQSGLDNSNAFLDSQQAQAELNAENLARQAWINSQLQGDSVKEALSASGLAATGALQSAQLGVQNNFNNSLANINSNLNDMTTNLAEQKLAALTDYNSNLAEYAYQIQNDEANRALQNAQLAMQQQEYQNALQQQQWQNAYNQQLLDFDRQKYADDLAKSQADAENDRKAQQASYYADLYRIGRINGAQYQQYLQQLGLI